MSKALAVGDPVLFKGRRLEVVSLKDGVAKCDDPIERAKAIKARELVLELRKEQAALDPEEKRDHRRLAQEIQKASISSANFILGLRQDLLRYWPEREVWVSDGRILSDEQLAEATKKLGAKPLPQAERGILDMLAPVLMLVAVMFASVLGMAAPEHMLFLPFMMGATYNKFEAFTEHLAEKVHNLDSDTLKVYLSNATPSASGDAVKADLAEISAGNGYTAGGEDTQNATSRAGGTTSVTGVDVTWTATGGAIAQFRYVALYNDTPTSPADPLIAWWDYGSPVDLATGESFTVDFGSSLFTIT